MSPQADEGRTWPLVGRASELDDLDDVLADTSDGAGTAVLLEGEAGVGKTCLVHALRENAQLLGMATLVRPARDGARLPDAGRPTLVVLEDLHDADHGALAELTERAHLGPPERTALVVTMRPVPRSPDVAEAVAAWTRAGARHLELRTLATGPAADLATVLAGGHPGPALRGLVATAAGNPRLLTDALATARSTGSLGSVDGGIDLVDDAWCAPLDALVRRRLGYLDDDVLHVLGRASVLGTSFVVGDLAELGDGDVAGCWRTLRHGLAAGLVRARGDRLVFSHDLVRGALYDGLPGDERRALHARAAWVLRVAGAPEHVVAGHLTRAR